MKKTIQLIAFIFLFNLLMPLTTQAAGFKDLSSEYLFNKEILYLSSEKIITGFPDETFRPDQAVTRAQAAIMIGRTLGLNDTPKNSGFSDVTSNVTGSGYIASAVEKGIITGFPDGTYRPNEPVNRGQMAIFLNRAFPQAASEKNSFSDVTDSMAAYQSILNVAASGIANGYHDGTYRPNQPVTRGQFSAFMARTLEPKFIYPLSTLTFDRTSVNLLPGEKEKLTLSFKNNPNVDITELGYMPEWFSKNQDIAVIDEGGEITGIAPGETTVGVRIDGVEITCIVTVKSPAAERIETPAEISLLLAQEAVIDVSIFPENAQAGQIIWTSSDQSIISVTNAGKIKGLKVGEATIKAALAGTNLSSQTVVTVKEDVLALEEVINAEEHVFEKYLNQHYSSLPTPLGDWNPEITVNMENNNVYIDIDWSGPSPYDLKYSDSNKEIEEYGKVLTDQDRSETKQLLRQFMEQIANDVFTAYPDRYIKGRFHTSGYKYKYIKEGYWSIQFLSWNNFDGQQIVPQLQWDPQYDDYNFVMDYEIRDIGYYHPQTNKVYFSNDYSDPPIQIKLGETTHLQLVFSPDELNHNNALSYKEMGLDISGESYYSNIEVDPNGMITGKRLGKDSIFVYHPRASLLINVEVVE